MTAETGAAVLISSLSALLLSTLGVDYYSLLWAAFGAVGALLYSAPTKQKLRAGFTVTLATLFGAALGTYVAEHINGTRSALIVCSIVCASGPQALIQALLNRFVSEIGRGSPGRGNDPTPPAP